MVWIGFKLGTVILSQFVENGAIVTMPNKDNQRFSPFFKDRYQIAYLRSCFGFPLKFVDNSFACLKFNPFLEYGKHVLNFIMILLCFVCISYVQMKRQQTGNLFSAVQGILSQFGISGLDTAVMTCLPVVNLISNSIYFISFKNNCTGLNRMTKSLTNINEDIYVCSGKNISEFRDRKWFGNKHFVALWFINVLCVAMQVLCWAIIFNESENVSNIEKIFFCLAQLFFIGSYIYPIVAYSADLLVTTLVYETIEAFDGFKVLLEYWNTTKRSKGSNQSDLGLLQKTISKSDRYALDLFLAKILVAKYYSKISTNGEI